MEQSCYEVENGGGGGAGAGANRNILLGKYEMGRLLGKGTFAKVYYGRNIKQTGESVAIKVLNIDQVKKEGLREQIKREISVMRLVRHPNVVQLKEVMATREKIYFIMEYVRGGELFDKVYRGKLQEDEARKYFQQLISAVDYCHSRGVSHRDLKPENLLLDDHGDLKISDFGLSALPEHLHKDGLLHTRCGTPAYVAPEVLKKKGYDGAKADIWSCGVILFVLLAGFLPFQDENIMKVYRKIFRAEFVCPRWFSSETKSLISKLLVADPEERITISSIMQVPWFKEGFTRNPCIEEEAKEEVEVEVEEEVEEDTTQLHNNDHCEEKENLSMPQSPPPPPFFNAFELISSMSSGFDLSNIFEGENKRKSSTMFTSKCPPSTIMAKLVSMAKGLHFNITKSKEFKLKFQANVQGRKGKLSVLAEISEVAPEVAIVELSKTSGDTLEYAKFCEEEARPALKDIVWTWQGEHNKSATT